MGGVSVPDSIISFSQCAAFHRMLHFCSRQMCFYSEIFSLCRFKTSPFTAFTSLYVFPSVIWLISRELLALVSQNTQNWHVGMICLACCDQKKGSHAGDPSLTKQRCTETVSICHRTESSRCFNYIRQKAQTFQCSLIDYCSWHVFFFSSSSSSSAEHSPKLWVSQTGKSKSTRIQSVPCLCVRVSQLRLSVPD